MAQASREGGFLGIGGQRVTDREKAAMAEIADLYGDQGYAFTNVIPLTETDPDARVVDVSFEIQRGGETLRLTLLEAMLLKLLVERRGKVVTKGEILEKVWNLDPETETRAVDNFVMRLRRHLDDDPRSPEHLQTVRGAGYRFSTRSA